MKSVDLNSNWSVAVGEERYNCDFPYDVTACAARDYSCAFGSLNGYIPTTRAVFTRALPQVKHAVSLRISGACGYGAVFVNDEKIGALRSYGPKTFYIPDGLPYAHNSLRIELTSSPEMSDKYVGLGIAGGVSLIESDGACDIEYNSLFVKTMRIGDKVYADTEMFVCNNGDSAEKFILECTALNARGKRAGKKQRKLVLQPHRRKLVSVRVRINNPYEWTTFDPYMYTMAAKLTSTAGESSASVRFGLAMRSIHRTRGLYINNKRTKLFGAYLSHADAAVGAASVYSAEKRRLEAIKSLGYNAVHFVDCPTDAALGACDDVGLYAYVDLFPQLGASTSPLGGIFNDGYYAVTERVEALRNHPCVTLYGVADDVPECYDRNDGHEFIRCLAERIKESDDTRPLTVSTRELVPTVKELESVGVKRVVHDAAAALSAGREKHLFETLTAGAFKSVDLCGLNYLYSLYDGERTKLDKPIIGSRSSADHAFESNDAAEKNDCVVGDFGDCGMDYPGGGKSGEILTDFGDIDAIGCVKPQGVYKQILLGQRNIAYIVSVDPETGEPVRLWNWPRYLGQKIQVNVYTSGDVVALYLDGKIVGRRLAGKVNKHIATFNVDYYPGTLEAVAYFKGVECARSQLKSASSPKTLSLKAYEKNLSVGRGDIGFVYIDVCDRDGTLVPYAMRTLSATVTGGTLINFINADPLLRKNDADSCPAYGGKALAVVKPDPAENKLTVKIISDGLLSSRISFKIKN